MSALALADHPAGGSPEALAGAGRSASATASAVVDVAGVSKVFGHGPGRVVALDDVSLQVAPGEFVCLVGASGCGKSTLLNLIAGLDDATAGDIAVAGRTSLMFQDAALMPWLTVRANVELALRLDGVGRRERRQQAADLLDIVQLGAFADRRPHELSGGMRQRVALARALARHTDVVLMDEPFGAVDAMTRDVLHDELEGIWRARGCAVVFVTHNVSEAVRLGDRVVVLSSRPGRVVDSFDVDVERPRRIDDPAVSALAARITDRLHAEVARHGAR